ncbi:hypothetical protein [Ralstonia mannitolilytica]|uniref:hypothetical protein n=1 Tax=Ralstonia mannitolilytica TaxID=105219 RepID=UPI00292F4232|nr:hypothetical protein [Ralstonia mannitolilytica]
MKLFKRRAAPAQVSVPEPTPTPAATPVPRKPGSKRKYGKGGRRHPAPKGARRIDPNGNILAQARGEQ